MNLTQITDRVRRNLDDSSAGFYSSADDIVPAIQDGYNLIVALTESIEKTAVVSFVSDLVFYDFTTYITDYLRIFGIYNNQTNRWMQPTSLLELIQYRDDWELTEGDPFLFLPIDHKRVALFPTPTVATGSMTVMYKARANTLGANTTPQVPEEQVDILENYATADLLTQAEEFYKALGYSALLEGGIEAILKVLRERSSPNQLYHMQEVF